MKEKTKIKLSVDFYVLILYNYGKPNGKNTYPKEKLKWQS